jgi:hypothetical protein
VATQDVANKYFMVLACVLCVLCVLCVVVDDAGGEMAATVAAAAAAGEEQRDNRMKSTRSVKPIIKILGKYNNVRPEIICGALNNLDNTERSTYELPDVSPGVTMVREGGGCVGSNRFDRNSQGRYICVPKTEPASTSWD